MPRKRADRPGQIGDYWPSRRPNSAAWCRTWFDERSRQTRRASLGTDDFEQAKLALAAWVTLNGRHEREQPKDVLLGGVFVRYMHQHGNDTRGSVQQRRNLRLVLEALPAGTTVAELTLERQAEAVRKLKDRGLEPATIKRAMNIAKAAVNRAWKNGELDRPVPFASLPDGPNRERALSVAELARFGMRR